MSLVSLSSAVDVTYLFLHPETAAEMLMLLRKQWKLYPITCVLVGSGLLLFIVTRLWWAWTWLPWGLAGGITLVHESSGFLSDLLPATHALNAMEGQDLQTVLETFGALGIGELWDGQIWRLLTSAFHHGFTLHLGGNLLVLWLLGTLIEEHYNRWWYAAFCVGSAIFSVAAEALNAQASVGLSGTGYAMFGFLVIVRLREPYIAMVIPRILVNAGIISMFVCLPITWLGYLPVANIAHFSGFGYGLAGGWVMIAHRQNLAHAAFALPHLLLIPLCFLATKPTWTDFYHDLQASRLVQSTDDPKVRVKTLQGLLAKYPDRTRLRVQLVSALASDNRDNEALSCALDGWDGTEGEMQQLLIRQIDELCRVADADHQVAAFESVLKESPHRTDARIHLVAALASADRRDAAWKVAIEGWDGTYSLPQLAIKQQIQLLWKLMPNPDAREAAEVVMDDVLGDRSEPLKEEFDLGWLSVESNMMWDAEAKRAANRQRQIKAPKPSPEIDPNLPNSAGFGRRL